MIFIFSFNFRIKTFSIHNFFHIKNNFLKSSILKIKTLQISKPTFYQHEQFCYKSNWTKTNSNYSSTITFQINRHIGKHADRLHGENIHFNTQITHTHTPGSVSTNYYEDLEALSCLFVVQIFTDCLAHWVIHFLLLIKHR